jgi:diketogulonate reductase-like aldo/keto reductase
MGLEYIDIYLLHCAAVFRFRKRSSAWRRSKEAVKIRAWGVSNLISTTCGSFGRYPTATDASVNQVLYHLGSRGVEYALLPWLREHKIR